MLYTFQTLQQNLLESNITFKLIFSPAFQTACLILSKVVCFWSIDSTALTKTTFSVCTVVSSHSLNHNHYQVSWLKQWQHISSHLAVSLLSLMMPPSVVVVVIFEQAGKQGGSTQSEDAYTCYSCTSNHSCSLYLWKTNEWHVQGQGCVAENF